MSTSDVLIVLGAFLACAVELVEALTIVLGVGVVRGWRSTLIGAGAAGACARARRRALGPALQRIPIGTLRFVVGALLLAFGLQWLRKAILRSSGYKALHDEDEAFRGIGRRPRRRCAAARRDWTGTRSRSRSRACCSRASRSCSSSIAFGSAQGRLGLAVAGAAAAVVVVVVAGVACGAACARAREHDQVRRRRAAHELRDLLGRRGRRRRLAGRRARFPRRARVRRARLVVLVRSLRRRRQLVPVGGRG